MGKVKSNSLFLIFLFLNVFCKGIGLGNDDKIYVLLLFVGLIFLTIKIFTDKYKKKELLYIAIILCIGLGTFLITKKITLLMTCICLAGMKNVDVDKTFKGMFYIRLITFVSVIALALLGIIENSSVTMWRDGGFETRYALGFGYANTLHLSLFLLIALYVYVRYKKLNVIAYGVMIISNIFIYTYSGSRTGFALVFVLILLTIISKYEFIQKVIIKSPKYVYIILLIASFLTAIFYGRVPILDKLNTALNGRIYFSNYYIRNYGFTLLGNNIASDTNALFDNGYLYMYIQFGIMGLLLVSSWIFMIAKNIQKNYDVRRGIIVISFLLYIFTESFTPNIFMNVILLFVAENIYTVSDKKEKDKGLNEQETNEKLYL